MTFRFFPQSLAVPFVLTATPKYVARELGYTLLVSYRDIEKVRRAERRQVEGDGKVRKNRARLHQPHA